ncbi:hypothetical protein CSHISOI_06713 [Colletotrichum shisoi]|uniref:Uncharacterized protein n=1 Tax=Colletotrichum shisoi TaxID=2078593 RepID=A0A5Q4BP43_9PEZI|nr:hypothetical protein CSHISOI_06713 [Colletotrichum shisoi]
MTEESVVENTGNAQERKAVRLSFEELSYTDKFGYFKYRQALLMSSAFGKSFIAAATFSHMEDSDIFM